ncbi:uncharacterized protein LOC110007202 [Amborella trichopoda]|uniref:uncharacterized protein LOC110007202 n=1 Tax=Amborella trichopoda TaxID=13333 RepID=UPI0009BD146F|nr:uncharacterized protein LOC110007202 [Amborella trichopoda]|eukprot:XP_020522543.1 uncharacterized protein LOC110007202 [Amborella trichopoda]
MFIRTTKVGICIVLLYVDDIIIFGDDFTSIKDVKLRLQEKFQMEDLLEASYFLGFEITRSKHGFYIHQHKYIVDLVSNTRLNDAKVVVTLLELNVKLSAHVGNDLPKPTMYHKLVGSLIYLTMIRPVIAYDIHVVS